MVFVARFKFFDGTVSCWPLVQSSSFRFCFVLNKFLLAQREPRLRINPP